MSYEDCIDKLTTYFSSNKYQTEVVTAKDEFFGDVGLGDTEGHEFERKLNLFYDWYLLTRPLAGTQLTPAKMVIDLEGFEMTAAELQEFKHLAQAKYSLFEYIKTKGRDHYAKDLLTGEKICVKNSSLNIIANKGSVFSTHFINDGQNNFFTFGMTFHPPEVEKFIFEYAKKLKNSPHEEQWRAIVTLIKMNFKLERYPHVGHDQIYSFNSPVRF